MTALQRPPWAYEMFADDLAWTRFVEGIRGALPAIDPAATLDEVEGYATASVDGHDATLGLANIARRFAASEDTAETLAAWVEMVLQTLRAAPAPAELTWDAAAPALRVQLYNDERHAGSNMVARAIAPDLHLALVIDGETSLMTVTPEMAAPWEKSDDDLFDRATANLYAALPVQPAAARVPPPLQIISSNDDYTAAAAYLALSELVPAGSLGALVMFATRFTCAFIPLVDRLPADAFQALLAGTARLFPGGEGALTPNLYWWRDQQLTMVPLLDVAGAKVAMWPDELRGLLK